MNFFSISQDVDSDRFTLHRKNEKNSMLDDATFNLSTFDAEVFMDFLLEIPNFQERAKKTLRNYEP